MTAATTAYRSTRWNQAAAQRREVADRCLHLADRARQRIDQHHYDNSLTLMMQAVSPRSMHCGSLISTRSFQDWFAQVALSDASEWMSEDDLAVIARDNVQQFSETNSPASGGSVV